MIRDVPQSAAFVPLSLRLADAAQSLGAASSRHVNQQHTGRSRSINRHGEHHRFVSPGPLTRGRAAPAASNPHVNMDPNQTVDTSAEIVRLLNHIGSLAETFTAQQNAVIKSVADLPDPLKRIMVQCERDFDKHCETLRRARKRLVEITNAERANRFVKAAQDVCDQNLQIARVEQQALGFLEDSQKFDAVAKWRAMMKAHAQALHNFHKERAQYQEMLYSKLTSVDEFNNTVVEKVRRFCIDAQIYTAPGDFHAVSVVLHSWCQATHARITARSHYAEKKQKEAKVKLEQKNQQTHAELSQLSNQDLILRGLLEAEEVYPKPKPDPDAAKVNAVEPKGRVTKLNRLSLKGFLASRSSASTLQSYNIQLFDKDVQSAKRGPKKTRSRSSSVQSFKSAKSSGSGRSRMSSRASRSSSSRKSKSQSSRSSSKSSRRSLSLRSARSGSSNSSRQSRANSASSRHSKGSRRSLGSTRHLRDQKQRKQVTWGSGQRKKPTGKQRTSSKNY